MFKKSIVFFILFLALPLFAVVDSASIVNGIAIAGKITQEIAQSQGHVEIVSIIGAVVLAVCNIFSFIWGHRHGVKSAGK